MNKEAVDTTGLIWHYTKGIHMESLMKEGVIRLATGNCEPNERSAVWFSSNQIWEKTVFGIYQGGRSPRIVGRDELCGLVGGLYRIGVTRDVAPHNWDDFKRLSGVSAKMAYHMKRVAYTLGARISEWFVTFEPVTRDKWVTIQKWNGKSWNESQTHMNEGEADNRAA